MPRLGHRGRSPTKDNVPYSYTLTLIGGFLLTAYGCGARNESFDTAKSIPSNSVLEFPASSSRIVVQYGSGQHSAKFHAELTDVKQWIIALQNQNPELNANPSSPDWLADSNEMLRPQAIAHERETFALRMGSPDGFAENLLKFLSLIHI